MPGDERGVHLAAGLLGHAERAVAQSGGDVLGGRAEARHLVVVNRRRPVHRDVRDDAASHQLDEQRRDSGLHDVAAEHQRRRRALLRAALAIASATARKSRATRTSGSDATNARNDRSSRGGCANSSVLDLVRAARDGDGADRGEIRFARQSRGRGVAVSVGGLLAGAGGVAVGEGAGGTI